MADNENRGPGRPPKAKLVEVVTLRQYCPAGFDDGNGNYVPQASEIKEKVARGTILRLPKDEASKGLKAGCLGTTENTLGD